MKKEILTTFDAAKICNVTMTTIVNWIKDGSLKAYKTKGSIYGGGHRRVKRPDLEKFIKKHRLDVL